jgi:hypothetical protein
MFMIVCFIKKNCFFCGKGDNSNLNIDISKIQLAMNWNRLWWPCLLMDRDGMSNLYRGPSIDASYQVSVHLAKGFQRRRFLKSTNQKQELPMVAILLTNRDKTNNLYRCLFTVRDH